MLLENKVVISGRLSASSDASCGGTTQNYWARVHWSLLLSNSDPNCHSPVVPRVKPRLKPRYSRISRQHSHEGEPRDYNTEHFIHLRVIAVERNLLQTMFRIVKYYRVPSTQFIQVSLLSGSIKKVTSEITWRIDKARTNASLSGRVVSTSWRAIPLNRPTRGQSTRPSKTCKQIFKVSTWKTVPQARLSILILSKTDPSPDIS